MREETSVKKARSRIENGGKTLGSLNHPGADQGRDAHVSATISRQYAYGKPVGAALATAVAAIVGLSFLATPLAQAQNLGSPPFANPREVRDRPSEKRLRAIMELTSGQYLIPNVGTETLRQFRGWDPAQPKPNFGPDLGPGPTLRLRLGDLVEISFLNKIDDSQFSYTFDTHSKPGVSSFGCDQSGTVYPGKDIFPNCFHGSSTANIHFHGTHTSPDGLSDNVLVQVLPQLNQPDWTATFNKIFDSGTIPQKWEDLPKNYRDKQEELIKQYDKDAAEQAKKNNLPPPESLWDADKKMIDGHQWPQYLMGAFPNFFVVPDYSSGNYKAGQAPGTHWYHAHKHGSTSLHILNGLAGAIIIESNQKGGYDQVIREFYGWGDTYGDHEKIIVFQQVDTTQNLQRAAGQLGAPQGGSKGPGSKQVLINGKLTPTITMQPGEVQLWRLVNATDGNNAGVIGPGLFQTKGFTFKQTAQDGVQFSPTNYQNQPFLKGNVKHYQPQVGPVGGLVLAGANRADLLVQAPTTPGVFAFKNGTPTLFFVEVTKGPPVNLPNGPFPTAWAERPKFLNDLPVPGENDKKNPDSPVKFQWEAGRVNGFPTNASPNPPHYMINNKQFGNPPTVDQCMPLDGLQDWVLVNETTVAHPFHIHINPFQVVEIDIPVAKDPTKPPDPNNNPVTYNKYTPQDNFVWQDVIAIPPAQISADGKQVWSGTITIRQTYVDFAGTYVLHCHILAHEDRGMMELVRVVPAKDYPDKCQDYVPQHH